MGWLESTEIGKYIFMKIQISGQYGDPKADDLFWPLQKNLNDCFNKHLVQVYFNTLVMFSIVFRVSGKIRDFGSEGPERMKYIKKESELTVDLVFTEASWRGADKSVFEAHVVDGVRECLRMMLDKSDSLNELTDINSFKIDVEKAISEFMAD